MGRGSGVERKADGSIVKHCSCLSGLCCAKIYTTETILHLTLEKKKLTSNTLFVVQRDTLLKSLHLVEYTEKD